MRRSFSSSILVKAVLTALCVCCLGLSAGQQASARTQYVIRAPQSWVRVWEVESEGKSEAGSSSSTFLLDDHQIKVSQNTVDRYYHHVQKIETAAGLGDVSQLKFYFEPSYQQLAIHFIRIRRDGAIINALKPAEIKVIQQEEELNQQLYNGTLATLIFLNDLRVGDIVDYAYTVSGENPVLGGRFADSLYMADRQPIQHLKFRLVWPAHRAIAIRKHNLDIEPSISPYGSDSEYIWERRDVGAVSVEDGTPAWFNPYPTVNLSEFQTWNDVVQWALPLYDLTSTTPAELTSKTQKWQADFSSPEERTVAALRFVQDEIRYLGIELGRYSHQPTSPAKVFARRFGDCKDKSLLLATLLKSMGIDAVPALVHSSEGKSLDAYQPSPFAFDHVIVQAKLGGKTYWFDPTISYQRGGLDKYYDPPYERALVMRAGTGELETIPLPTINAGFISVNEKYEGQSSRGPISLQVSTTYVGDEADNMRQFLSGYSLAELGKTYLNFYGEANPSIKAVGLPEVHDNQVANTILVREKYLISEFWKENTHYFLAEKIGAEATKPGVTQRSMPLRITYPLSISETIEINLSERYNITAERGTISNEAFRFDYDFSASGNNIKLEYSLKTLADSVPVDRIPQHLSVVDRIRNYVGFELTNGPGTAVGVPSVRASGAVGLVFSLIVVVPLILLVTVYLVRNRRRAGRKTRFATQVQAKPGFTPETAIRVAHETDIDSSLRYFQCTCGQSPYNPESPPQRERFTYDDQRLIGIRLHCTACGRNYDLYFHSASNQSSEVPSLQIN